MAPSRDPGISARALGCPTAMLSLVLLALLGTVAAQEGVSGDGAKRELGIYPNPGGYTDPDFYVKLKQNCYSSQFSDSKKWFKIESKHFDNGTFRILKSGCYYLSEDHEFEPNARCCDYWPKFDTSNPDVYPMGVFTLGFFAAITIEAPDVLLDLNGHTLKQSLEFSLKQRFFNTIQVASRVFEAHDGMPSLNLQNGEKLVIQGRTNSELSVLPPDPKGDKAELPSSIPDSEKRCPRKTNFFFNQPNRVPERIIIRNGVLGRTSHNAIHGNGAPSNIVVEDLACRDFEVAGIQFNGAKNLVIRRVAVGPNIRPFVLGTFSSVRFIGFWFAFFWRRFWTEDEKEMLLRKNFITFHDRPGKPVSLFSVFRRLLLAELVYADFIPDQSLSSPSFFPFGSIDNLPGDEIGDIFKESEQILRNSSRKADFWRVMNESNQAWGNPTRLPDGGALYGINLHRRRKGVHKLGEEAWNFYGPDEDSTQNVRIYNVSIRDLRTSPIQVPALSHSQGGILNGPTGEVLRISDMAYYEGQFSLRSPSVYKGNIHSDALFAFYKVAHDFWQYSVWGITPAQGLYDDERVTCGNNPNIDAQSNITCPAHLPQTPKGPRACDDLANLQKRFFGGIRMSPELYTWATKGLPKGLQSMLEYDQDPDTRKGKVHKVACGGDTMFHSIKGLIPLKIDFADNVIVDGLSITNVSNTADFNNWFCDHTWSFPDSNTVGPMTVSEYKGGDVTAAVVTKSFNTVLRNIRIDHVESEEGRATGIDLVGDDNGRAMFRKSQVPQVTMINVAVGSNVRAGEPGFVTPIKADVTYLNLGGFVSNEAANLQNNWKPPKTSITFFSDWFGMSTDYWQSIPQADIRDALSSVSLDSIVLRQEAIEYFITRYGLTEQQSGQAVLKGVPSGLRQYVQLLCWQNNTFSGHNARSSYDNVTCDGPWSDSEVMDIHFALSIDEGTVLKGSYAGPTGGLRHSAGYEVRYGVFIIKDLSNKPVIMRYYSLMPELTTSDGLRLPLQRAVHYELFCDRFGHGIATGTQVFVRDSQSKVLRFTSTLHLSFDDIPTNFQIAHKSDDRFVPSSLRSSDLVLSFDTTGDGRLDDFDPVDPEVAPLTRSYWLRHEAGIKDMRRWLKEDDLSIVRRRDQFLSTLKDRFGIVTTYPLPLESQWIENEFNGIVPYTQSHNTDLRLRTGVGLDNDAETYNYTRVIEVGFRYDGDLGTIKQGVYIFENCEAWIHSSRALGWRPMRAVPCNCLPINPEIDFTTIIPSRVNELNQAFVYESVSLRKYPSCQGVYQAVSIQEPWKDQNVHEVRHNIAGSFKFYGQGCSLVMTDGYRLNNYS